MLNIAICDDNAPICSQIERILDSHINEIKTNISIFYSPEKFINALRNGEFFDLVFLDIEFPDSNGIEIGGTIRNELKNESIEIVYISAQERYAMQLFDYRPLHFLIKPLNTDKIITVVKKTLIRKKDANEIYSFVFKNKLFQIFYKDIIYFESKGKKMHIFTSNGEGSEFIGKMKDLKNTLNSEKFLQIHQSLLVNMAHIKDYQYKSITLINGVNLPISQANRKDVRAKLLRIKINNMHKRE